MNFPGWRNFERYGGLQIREEDCSYVWQVPSELRCKWVGETEKCISGSAIQYTKILFCVFSTQNIPLFTTGFTLLFLWLLYLFLILGTTADNFFCPSLAVIATVFRLSDSIAGVTILAFGNGAPDIFTSLVSSQDRGIIVLTELMGAGVFVTAIIAGSVAVAMPFNIYPKFFMRDCCFYIFAACWIAVVIQDEVVHLWEALSFIMLYISFIVVVVLMQVYDSREEKRKRRIPGLSDADILQTYLANRDADGPPQLPRRARAFSVQAKLDVAIAREIENLKSQENSMGQEKAERGMSNARPAGLFSEFLFDLNPINREEWSNGNAFAKTLLIIRSPFMVILQLFIPVVNETAEKRGWSKLLNCLQIWLTPNVILVILKIWNVSVGTIPLIAVCSIFSTTIAIIVFFVTTTDKVPKYHNAFAFLGFFTAMLVVYVVAQEVMSVLECIGFASGISEAMLGITFLAWGNSVGDLISNIAVAKKGFPRMGFSACFGGPMFNTLLGLGLTYGIASGQMAPEYKIKIRTSDMSPGCLAFLLCSLVTSIMYLNITGFRARRSYGYLLYSLYFAFMLINLLSEMHVIHPLGTDHRADEFDNIGQ